ncbi:MAG: hypothetical protein AAB375_03185 [Patescibacteria group bacterium]
MGKDALLKAEMSTVADVDGVASPPTDRDLLIQIVRLQMQLNSKMFEFLRAYQAKHNWGEHGMFSDGNGEKNRVGRLRDEVNELGVALGQAVSVFTGEQVYEKRDEAGRVLVYCRVCRKESAFAHIIDTPYGIDDAYIDGSERLVCVVCKKDRIFPGDERLPKFNCVFGIE